MQCHHTIYDKETQLKGTHGYFISNQHTHKGLDPNVHVIGEIYNINERSNLHVLVANYTKNMSHLTKESA